MPKVPTPEELVKVDYSMPAGSWMDTKPEFVDGSFCYPAKAEIMEGLGMPNPHTWNPAEEDWGPSARLGAGKCGYPFAAGCLSACSGRNKNWVATPAIR